MLTGYRLNAMARPPSLRALLALLTASLTPSLNAFLQRSKGNSCQPCNQGEYNDEEGKLCRSCPDGTFSDDTGLEEVRIDEERNDKRRLGRSDSKSIIPPSLNNSNPSACRFAPRRSARAAMLLSAE